MKILKVLCLLVIFSNSAYSFDFARENELNTIFSQAIEAVGGKKAVSKIRSIEAFAICNGPKGKYTTEITSFRNGKTNFKQTFSYNQDTSNIFINRSLAWGKCLRITFQPRFSYVNK